MKSLTYLIPFMLALGCKSPAPAVQVKCLGEYYLVQRETDPSTEKQEVLAGGANHRSYKVTLEVEGVKMHLKIDDYPSGANIFTGTDTRPFDGFPEYFSLGADRYSKDNEKLGCYYDKEDGCRKHPKERELGNKLFLTGLCLVGDERINNKKDIADKLK